MTIGAVFGRGQPRGPADYFMSLDGYDKRFSQIADSQVYIALDRGASVKEVRPKVEAIAKQFPGAKVNDVSGLRRSSRARSTRSSASCSPCCSWRSSSRCSGS